MCLTEKKHLTAEDALEIQGNYVELITEVTQSSVVDECVVHVYFF